MTNTTLPTIADSASIEMYRAIALSTAHITVEDNDVLQTASDDPENNVVMSRESGFLVKLSALDSADNLRYVVSEEAKNILRWAETMGCRLVEFDNAASEIDGFPIFDW